MRTYAWMLVASLAVGCGNTAVNPGAVAPESPTRPRVAPARPAGTSGPVDFQNQSVSPKLSPGFVGPVPTNDWWSSLVWPFYPGNRYSENLFAHPMGMHAQADGLAVGYPDQATFPDQGRAYEFVLQEDLRLRTQGLNVPQTTVDAASDWAVTARWGNFTTTMGHGLPFIYARGQGTAEIACAAPPSVFSLNGNVLGFTVRGHHYGLFAPTGSVWTQAGNTFRCDLKGKDYFSLGLLPDPAALELFRTHAYAFVTDTKVSWTCDTQVRTRFEATTTPMETGNGLVNRPLMALYRHQWLHTQDALTPWKYVSARGEMRLLDGSSFTTTLPAGGILPNLPDAGNLDRPRLVAYLQSVADQAAPANLDSYWMGKALGRLAALAPLAEQVGRNDLRDKFLDRMQTVLNDWLDGTAPNLFAYDPVWNTAIGYPSSYGSDTQLNDHHFHYGYFVMAAATLARYRPDWASAHQADVNELIADPANSDRSNTKYPFLRNFDPYAGHSWASGAQMFASGNNQESSSEALNFASGVALWGAATGQDNLRDLGVWLHAVESESVGQYWFDVDQAVFPAGFEPEEVGIVWGNTGSYATFWTANPEEIHGINFLPLTGGSLYLGRWPQALQRNYADLLKRNSGPEQEWKDIIQMALALVDPDGALARFEADPGAPSEDGESKAHTYHWLKTLTSLGTPDRVGADWPTAATFRRGTERNYVAYNPTGASATVTFADGRSFAVPARQVVLQRGTANPVPSPTPAASPSPLPAASPSPVVLPSPSPAASPAGPSSTRWHLSSAGRLSAAPGPTSGTVALDSAGGTNHDGTPFHPQAFEVTGLTGRYAGGTTRFALPLDAGSAVATGTQARLTYDCNGDGTPERVETYLYFPCNDVPGWELYSDTRGLRTTTGSLADFTGGSLKLEVWNAIGRFPVNLRIDDASSWVELPLSGAPAPTPTPTPTPTATPTPTPAASPTTFAATLYPSSTGLVTTPPSGQLTLASADGINRDGQPYKPLTLKATGLTGRYTGGSTAFQLLLDAGSQVACASQIRVSYDFDGNGTADRVETWRYFPTNDVPGWETYTQNQGLASQSGAFADFRGGSVTVDLWSALGRFPTSLKLDGSSKLVLPFQ